MKQSGKQGVMALPIVQVYSLIYCIKISVHRLCNDVIYSMQVHVLDPTTSRHAESYQSWQSKKAISSFLSVLVTKLICICACIPFSRFKIHKVIPVGSPRYKSDACVQLPILHMLYDS